MRLSRRSIFFLAVVFVCLVLAPPSPPEFRWVNYVMAGLAGFWALAMSIGRVARRPGTSHVYDLLLRDITRAISTPRRGGPQHAGAG